MRRMEGVPRRTGQAEEVPQEPIEPLLSYCAEIIVFIMQIHQFCDLHDNLSILNHLAQAHPLQNDWRQACAEAAASMGYSFLVGSRAEAA